MGELILLISQAKIIYKTKHLKQPLSKMYSLGSWRGSSRIPNTDSMRILYIRIKISKHLGLPLLGTVLTQSWHRGCEFKGLIAALLVERRMPSSPLTDGIETWYRALHYPGSSVNHTIPIFLSIITWTPFLGIVSSDEPTPTPIQYLTICDVPSYLQRKSPC